MLALICVGEMQAWPWGQLVTLAIKIESDWWSWWFNLATWSNLPVMLTGYVGWPAGIFLGC